jgi:hypothetical protein
MRSLRCVSEVQRDATEKVKMIAEKVLMTVDKISVDLDPTSEVRVLRDKIAVHVQTIKIVRRDPMKKVIDPTDLKMVTGAQGLIIGVHVLMDKTAVRVQREVTKAVEVSNAHQETTKGDRARKDKTGVQGPIITAATNVVNIVDHVQSATTILQSRSNIHKNSEARQMAGLTV